MKTVVLEGIISRFSGDGRKLGYPTANLAIQTDLKDGVYFGFADLMEWQHHPAMIFIGTPTTMGSTIRRVEACLLDIPDQDYYDETLKLEIHQFHRGNKKFDNLDQLKKAMKTDENTARHWFEASNGSGRL